MKRLTLLLLLAACTAADAMAPTSHLAALSTVTWTATGGTITTSGLYTAGQTPGAYRVIATAEGKADTSLVTICALAGSLTLNTHSATLTVPDTLQLLATVTNQCNVADTSVAVTWASRTPAVATVASTGTQRARATAVASGSSWIVATAGARRDSALVCVSGAHLDVTPATASIVGTGTAVLAGSVTNCGSVLGTTVTWVTRNGAVATVAALGTQTATVTGVAAGSVYIVGDASGPLDSSLVVVHAAETVTSGCPTAGYLRLVNVSTKTQLTAATSGALPGDQIRLAAGTYLGGWPAITRSGTAANPIVICGPRTAVVDLNANSNLRLQADYWTFRGFRITDFPSTGFHIGADASTGNNHHNIIDSLEIDHAVQELLAINGASHHNIVQNNYFHHSGTGTTNAEEGVYVGEATSNSLPLACDNQILRNTFDNIGTESIDTKGGACRTIVQDNVIDGSNTRFVNGNAVSLISIAGDDTIVRGNTLSYGSPHGIVFWSTSAATALRGVVEDNTIHLFNVHNVSGQAGIRVFTGATLTSCTGNVVDNIPAGGTAYSGWTCTP